MKKGAKAAIKKAEELGYQPNGSNAKGWRCFVNPSIGHEILINPSCDDRAGVRVIQQMQRAVGEQLRINKRNPLAVRERQALKREQARQQVEAHKQLLAELQARRLRVLASIPTAITAQEVLAIEAHIEATQRRLREMERLMREIPES